LATANPQCGRQKHHGDAICGGRKGAHCLDHGRQSLWHSSSGSVISSWVEEVDSLHQEQVAVGLERFVSERYHDQTIIVVAIAKLPPTQRILCLLSDSNDPAVSPYCTNSFKKAIPHPCPASM
jgi:hypothetical protein